jgi:peptidoglycan L-alanyl-D-glutamate endopeptidase CwlK
LIQFTGTNTINGAETLPTNLSARSLKNLTGVHPDLVKVVMLAAEKAEFVVTEGVRTLLRQSELVKAGASQTMKSRHLTGHAVDLAALVGGEVRWDWPLYNKLAATMKESAIQLGVPLEWGGDWKSFKDGPHFQLPWKDYP